MRWIVWNYNYEMHIRKCQNMNRTNVYNEYHGHRQQGTMHIERTAFLEQHINNMNRIQCIECNPKNAMYIMQFNA